MTETQKRWSFDDVEDKRILAALAIMVTQLEEADAVAMLTDMFQAMVDAGVANPDDLEREVLTVIARHSVKH